METTTSIDAVIGKKNIFDIDATIDITAKTLEFVARHTRGGTPVISKGNTDMNITNALQGQFQIILDPVDTQNITTLNTLGEEVPVEALMYEVNVDTQRVASGVMYLLV